MTRLGIGGLPLLCLRFVGTFAVATASFYLIELPMLRLKERFQEVPGSGPVGAPEPGPAQPPLPTGSGAGSSVVG
jgi:peptidoglycan/LPS O-acetylase OafA/YrhL